MTPFAFLFGSGISLRAGFPSTSTITEAVLTAQRISATGELVQHVRYYTDGSFEFTERPDESPSLSGPLLQLILRLLSQIKREVDTYYDAAHFTTYEEIYFVLFQLESTVTRELDNPAIDALTRDLRHGFPESDFSAWTVVGTFDALHYPTPFKFGASRAHAKLDLDRPLFLIGTHNKPLEYTNSVYEDLHAQLYLALKNVRRLIVCGYGFNDKGINTRLIHWMSRSDNHRIVLIHKNPEDCISNARGAIEREWHYWGTRTNSVRQWAEDVAWSELRKTIA